MGVQGLSSFIDKHPVLLKDHLLRDTKIIIDGNNMYHMVYYRFSVEGPFGGDYDEFGNIIRWIINMFKSCNIEPYIVFDGSYEPDDRKLNTTIRRAKDRIRDYSALSKGYSQDRKIPLMCRIVFLGILDEMKIPYFQTDFEADDQIAILANELNCPVLSDDSDFFVFHISRGFIPFGYLNFILSRLTEEEESDFNERANVNDEYITTGFEDCNLGHASLPYSKNKKSCISDLKNADSAKTNNKNKNHKRNSLTCQIYYSSNFVKYFGLAMPEHFYFMTALLGTDFIPSGLLEPFLDALTRMKLQGLTKGASTHGYGKILLARAWLRSLNKPDKFIDGFLSVYPENERRKFEGIITQGIAAYSNPPKQFDLGLLAESLAKMVESKLYDSCDQIRFGESSVADRNGGIRLDKSNAPINQIRLDKNHNLSDPIKVVKNNTSGGKNKMRLDKNNPTSKDSKLHYPTGLKLPQWFILDVRLAKISSNLLYVALRRQIFNNFQIENYNQISTNDCSLPLRKAIYSIICKRIDSESIEITEFDRHNDSLCERQISVTFDDETLPYIDDVPKMTVDERLAVFLHVLCIDGVVLHNFAPNFKLMAASLMYWLKHCRVKDCHLKGVFVGMVYTFLRQNYHKKVKGDNSVKKQTKITRQDENCVNEELIEAIENANSDVRNENKIDKHKNAINGAKLSDKSSENRDDLKVKNSNEHRIDLVCKPPTVIDLTEMCNAVSDQQMSKILEKLEPMRKFDEHTWDKSTNNNSRNAHNNIIHSLAQLQAIVYTVVNLNEVLRYPLEYIRLDHVYNSTLIYHLCTDLQRKSKVDEFIRELLVSSEAYEMYKKLFSVLGGDELTKKSFQSDARNSKIGAERRPLANLGPSKRKRKSNRRK